MGGFVIKSKSNKKSLPRGKRSQNNIDHEVLFALEHCPDVLWSYNLDKQCWNYISPSVKYLNGYGVEEAMVFSLEEIFTPSTYQYFMEKLPRRLELFNKDESIPHMNRDEMEVNCKDGTTKWCDVTSQCIRNGNDDLTLTGVARGLQERSLVEEALLQSIKKHREILSSIEEGYYEIDRQGKLTFSNDAAFRLCGYTRSDFISLDYKELFKDPEAVKQKFKQVYLSRKPESNFTAEIIRKDGITLFMEMSISPMYSEDDGNEVIGFRGVARDITERVVFQQQLEYHSMHDQLTGLYNRNYFEEELVRLTKSRDYPISMISADVNGLKLINDTMGHDHGDRLLKAASEVLTSSLRGSDVLSRVGGDEFTAILLRADEKVVEKVIKRIKNIVAEYNKEQNDLYLSLSLGAATAANNDTSFQELYKRADDQMYRDKLSPGSKVRGRIVKSLLSALEKRDFIADGHGRRLALLCRKVGERVKLSPRQMANLTLLAQVHDLGKVGIPEPILFKEGPLSAKEWLIIKEHPEKGHRIALSSNYLNGIAGLILKHHERWNGSGYPLGLRGLEIPIECRIFAIADAYDTMTNHRPYYSLKTKKEALKELKDCSGSQFDPDLCALFISVLKG